ncbi:hypothetical protein T484DRAFT_1846059 [Baffinella frigidus]|nr:hypothetical protein T484DRAFT_1846059 [Cryptophyta sp. CCMP2293]
MFTVVDQGARECASEPAAEDGTHGGAGWLTRTLALLLAALVIPPGPICVLEAPLRDGIAPYTPDGRRHMAKDGLRADMCNRAVRFDHPTEGFVFLDRDKIIIAVKVARCHSDACGRIQVVLVNRNSAGLFDMQPNEFGEVRLHVSLPALPDGEYTAEVKLVDQHGAELSYHLYQITDKTRCEEGACLCEAGWAGVRCEHDILSNNTFIPDIDPSAQSLAPVRCRKSKVNSTHPPGAILSNNTFIPDVDPSAQSLAPVRCRKSKVLVADSPPHGLGTNIHYLSVLLAKEEQRGFEWHWHPLSTCDTIACDG